MSIPANQLGNPNLGENYEKFLKRSNTVIVPSADYYPTLKLLEDYGASLILIPQQIGNGVLPTYLPNDGSADFTVTRNSIGSYFNRDGELKIAGLNQPRLDFNPTNREYKGVLIEESAVNLIIWNNSQMFGGDSYSGLTNTTPNIINNCFGNGINGYQLIHGTSTFISASFAIGGTNSGNPVNISTIGYTKLQISFIIQNPSTSFLRLDISNITLTSGSTTTLINFETQQTNNTNDFIYKIGGNTYFVVLNRFKTSDSGPFTQIRMGLVSDSISIIPVNNGSFILGGLTMFANNSTYVSKTGGIIISSGSITTKPEDTVIKNGISHLIGVNNGTIYCEVYKQSTSFSQICVVGSNPEFILFSLSNDSFRVGIRLDGGTTVDKIGSTPSTSPLPDGTHKLALTYGNGQVRFFCDGQYVGNRTYTGEFDTLSNINLGRLSGSIAVAPNSGVKLLSTIQTSLTDQEAINLTK